MGVVEGEAFGWGIYLILTGCIYFKAILFINECEVLLKEDMKKSDVGLRSDLYQRSENLLLHMQTRTFVQ